MARETGLANAAISIHLFFENPGPAPARRDSETPMKIEPSAPLVAIPACIKAIETHRFHSVGEKYVTAIASGAAAMPFLLPALGSDYDLPSLIDRFDGFLFTGSSSNVEPHHYDGHPPRDPKKTDPNRDATTLPLIRAVIAAGVPMLAICRGNQELNVAFGGTLHQHLEEIPGNLDHRGPQDTEELDLVYGLQHPVELVPDGQLAQIAGTTRLDVNSVHNQGIDRLAEGLVVEARAPDGVIEAVRVRDAKAFALGIQWHPEYNYWERPFAVSLFKAFGEACRAHAATRQDRRIGRVA